MVTGYVDQASVRIDCTEGVSAALKKVQANMTAAIRQAVSIGPALTRAMSGITSSFFRVGNSINGVGQAMANAGTRATIFGGLGAAAFGTTLKSASDLEEAMNRFNALFGVESVAAKAFADNLGTAIRRSSADMLEAMSDFQGVAVGLGLDRKAARLFSQDLVALSRDFASFHNVSDSEATDRFLSGLSGQMEAVRRYGIDLSAAKLEMMGVGEEASQLTKVMTRYKLIRESLQKQNAIGDAQRTSHSTANSMKAFSSASTDAKNAIGKSLTTTVTTFLNAGLIPVVQWIGKWSAANPALTASIAGVTVGVLAFGADTIVLGTTLSSVGTIITAFSGLLSAAVLPLKLLVSTTALATTGFGVFGKVGITGLMASLYGLQAVLGGVQTAFSAAFVGSGLIAGMTATAVKAVAAFSTAFRAGFVAKIPAMLASFLLLGVQMQIAAGAMAAKVAISFTSGFGATALVNMQIVTGRIVAAMTAGLLVPMLSMATTVAVNMQIVFGSMAARIATTLVTTILPAAAMIAANLQIVFGTMASRIAIILSSTVASGLASALAPVLGVVTAAAGTMAAVVSGIFGSLFSGLLASSLSVIGTIGAALGSTILAALSPVIAIVGAIGVKFLVLTAIAAGVVAVFYTFRSQIGGVFAAIGNAVSNFSSRAVASVGSFLTGAKSVFADVFEFAKGQFTSLLAIGQSTFASLSDAVKGGDFKLAFQIAFAGAKEAAFSFMFDAVDRWGGTIESFVKGLIELKFWFQKTFAEITGFVKVAFETMENARQTAVNSISQGIIAGLVKVGAVDASVMQTLQEDIGRQQSSKASAIANETANNVAKLESEKRAALGGVGSGVAKFKAGLNAALASASAESKKLAGEAAAAAAKNAMATTPPAFPGMPSASGTVGDMGETVRNARQSIGNMLSGLSTKSQDAVSAFVEAANPSIKLAQEQLAATKELIAELKAQPKAIGGEFSTALSSNVGTANFYRT